MLPVQPSPDGPPAPFRTWKQLFWAVLIIHALIILCFYLFTLRFHPG